MIVYRTIGPLVVTIQPVRLSVLTNVSRSKTVEPCHEKTCILGFRPGLTQTELYKHKILLEVWNFRFREYRNCINYVALTKVLIS